MPSYKKTDSAKFTIVVIGGGFGGLGVINNLSSTIDPQKHDLILVDARPIHISLPSTLRLVVSDTDNLIEKTFHPYGEHTFRKKLAGNGDSSRPPGDSVVKYDILVLATGSIWPGPIAFPTERSAIEEHVKVQRKEFAKASDILLVGGGAFGIELAGELKDVFPSKPITIIHRGRLLLNAAYPDRYRIALQKQLEGRGITVLIGDAIAASDATDVSESNVPNVGFVTKQGKHLKPDLVIPTWGIRPNTSFLPSDLLSSTGHVKILPTFQLPAHPNVFALGDIIDWQEQKSAAKAIYFHATKVVKNILTYLSLAELEGRSGVVDLPASRKSAKYNGSLEMIIVTNGKSSGVGYFGVLVGHHYRRVAQCTDEIEETHGFKHISSYWVCFVLALEAAHTAAAIQIVWSGTVAVATSYSTCEASLFETVITISVQAYYFHRIGQLSSKTWLSLLGWFVTTVSFGVGLFTNYQSFILEAVQWQLEWGWLVKVSFAGIATVDIFITGLLCYYLKRASAPAIKVPLMTSSAELVNRLIIWTVETGMLTSITSIAVLICFQMMDSNWIWYGLYLPMGKLYSNSLLASLNARASRRKMLGMVQMLSDAGSLATANTDDQHTKL
ncbi:FAD/NAD(P)-binding domain-containing protein [Gymnopus androsaceus JB14]|uniref:FAD/NAD(P)-binding domain-containing protein n=1 Tax=Gymnopus androsaceus JB14 TaxID=1447944 RepID=A0A6A4HES6_9AGAR|nr:FAD/NAD(P)-binding domain-containing protein [Gymnopus androsaceus JB14]